MQKRENHPVAQARALWSEVATEPATDFEASDDGLRLLSAFMRIRDPDLRAAAIDFVAQLAERSEQA